MSLRVTCKLKVNREQQHAYTPILQPPFQSCDPVVKSQSVQSQGLATTGLKTQSCAAFSILLLATRWTPTCYRSCNRITGLKAPLCVGVGVRGFRGVRLRRKDE